jgi:hypothetical protein
MIKHAFLKIFDWLIKPRSIGAIFLLVITFLGINYSVFSILSPLKVIKTINNSVVVLDKNDKMPDISNQEINNLYREKAYYESKLALAKSDSLILSVDFPDSLITIEIKGIPIHSIALKKFRNTNFFSLIKNEAFQQIYSVPQRIINSQATAQKEPIKIVNAPKDTNEYNASGTNTNYDTSAVKLTFVEYETNQGFRMIFIPIEERNFHNWLTEFKFTSKLIWRNFKTSFRSSVQFRVPEFHPTVYIYLSQDDILSMHRALPEHAEVCVHY